jgi:undecaprenyl phosphate-alpha-L-ara4N flippase subunit ArnF
MTSLAFGLGLTLFTAIVVIAGDIILKLAADRDHTVLSGLVVAGCLLYAASALLWFGAMRHVTLAQAGVAYSMFTLIALALLGALVFGERLEGREIAGLGCALAAMALMSRVA